MFLALAYFGCDQSQVQRYLTGKSVAQSRLSLLFNAMAKIPMQFFILFIGAMVFVFFIFEKPPLLFQPVELKQRPAAIRDYPAVEQRYDQAFAQAQAKPPRSIWKPNALQADPASANSQSQHAVSRARSRS